MTESPLTYDGLKALALKLGRPVKTLYALSAHCDPFYCGPVRQSLAEWFKTAIWPLLDPNADGEVHIRRVHYLIVSQPAETRPLKLDGTPYENTHEDWRLLCDASLAARELALVDADRFVDRRAGRPTHVFVPTDEASDAFLSTYNESPSEPSREHAPSLSYYPQEFKFPSGLPRYTIITPKIVEPYVIEIWCEKSTMNDILYLLARRRGVTLVTGVGELSHAHCNWLVNRTLEHQRKCRILYISDHDPAGDLMPVGVARKIEHILRRDGHDLDIRLDPLVLTADQVARYNLPRVPIKDSDKSKNRFEARHGEGGVELDALEAVRPGELARIVDAAIDVYRQPTRDTRAEINQREREYRSVCAQIEHDIHDRHHDELAALHADFDTMQSEIESHQAAIRDITTEIENQFSARFDEHVDAINDRVAAFQESAESLWQSINDALDEEAPDIDDWPEPYEADESEDQLFQSERHYLEQINRYKKYQGKPVERRPRTGGRKGGRPKKGTNGNGTNGNGGAS